MLAGLAANLIWVSGGLLLSLLTPAQPPKIKDKNRLVINNSFMLSCRKRKRTDQVTEERRQ